MFFHLKCIFENISYFYNIIRSYNIENKSHKLSFVSKFDQTDGQKISQYYRGTADQLISNKHFERSQKLRKDGIGIWKNFIGNMLSNCIL